MGSLRPADALTLDFATVRDTEEARDLTLTWQGGPWESRLAGCIP